VELWPAEHGLTDRRAIQQPVWEVLRRLRRAGHEAYLVGGSVRDLWCGQAPKDYDVVTSASLREVRQRFGRACCVVGKRFPVALVDLKGWQIEVTSFQTGLPDGEALPLDCSRASASDDLTREELRRSPRYQREWDAARRENALRRDFTVNALLFDPFQGCLYDYVGGLWALRRRQIRSVMPPVASFMEDPARILRAVRFAGRTGFRIEPGTLEGLQDNLHLLQELPKSRLMMEVNALLSHGAAARSFLLLYRLKALDLLFPGHARYLRQRRVARAAKLEEVLEQGEPLFLALAELDRRVEPRRPVESAVWVSLLAAPFLFAHLPESEEISAALEPALAVVPKHSAAKASRFLHRLAESPSNASSFFKSEGEAAGRAAVEGLVRGVLELAGGGPKSEAEKIA
jgi:poly(A) polymerase